MTTDRTMIGLADHFDGIQSALEKAQSVHEILRRLLSAGNMLGLAHVSVLALPPLARQQIEPQMIVTSFPEDLAATFDAAGLGGSSPNFRHFRQSATPFIWHLDNPVSPPASARHDELVSFLRRYGINCGIECIALNSSAFRTIIGFYGLRESASGFSEAALLQQLTTVSVERLANLAQDTDRLPHWLTARELECLSWSEKGKTSADIGVILGLSEYTVNGYIASATGKLNAQSRIHAVAEAIRRKLI